MTPCYATQGGNERQFSHLLATRTFLAWTTQCNPSYSGIASVKLRQSNLVGF